MSREVNIPFTRVGSVRNILSQLLKSFSKKTVFTLGKMGNSKESIFPPTLNLILCFHCLVVFWFENLFRDKET